jgi:hypothetical protein
LSGGKEDDNAWRPARVHGREHGQHRRRPQGIEAYLAQDADTAARLLADNFVFTSPQDDHIDKAACMERCFPTADRLVSQEILDLVPAGDECRLFLCPVFVGGGERCLPAGVHVELELLDERRFGKGIVYLRYGTLP